MSEFKPELRDAMEIQSAHDMLSNILTGQVFIGEISPLDKKLLTAALDVLCWALKHDHNTKFETDLKMLRDALAEAGYVAILEDAPFTLEDLQRRR